jgi:uncharacterized protein YcfL
MKRFILLAVASLLLAACGSGRPMPVEVKKKKTLRWTVIEVHAVADEVTIENILLNRGECQPPSDFEKKTLKRSETDSIKAFGCANVTEVQVVTDTGSYDFSF